METKPTDTATTAARDAERKERAIAFLREGKKAGRPWATKEYKYDRAPDAQEETK